MMSISTELIETALGQHLATMASVPTIAWQNKNLDPARPFLVADHIPVGRTDPTIDGYGETVIGQYRVTVVINGDGFTTAANALADNIMVRFKYMTLINFADGDILITKPPEVLPGYRDGPDWRVPVRIDYGVQT